MPLLKRKPFQLLETPNDIQPHEPVFQVRFTKEIFRDYQEYLKRIDMYRKRVWTCKVTGKTNMTYEEALVSEQQATEKVQQFPEELIEPVLRIVQYSMLPLRDLLRTVSSKLQDSLPGFLEIQARKDGCLCSCKIVKVLDDEEGKKYEVAWLDDQNKINGTAVLSEGDLVRKRLPYTRDVLKSFIKECTYNNVPWVIHKNLASKYGIPTDPPEELKGKVTVLNGCIVSCKKRKKHEASEGENNDDKESGKEDIKYPIDDLLVQSCDDDKLVERPSPSRDYRVPMDCVGDLLMVWDFCTTFGRLVRLSPFSLEDFEKAICHKESNISIIVEIHSALLLLLIKDEGEYYSAIEKKKRKPKISKVTWTEYLCDFLEMINVPVLSTNIGTIKRGHYGLLDFQVKVGILRELVDQAIASTILREKLDENIEKWQELAAEKREEALEDGKKRREAKELLKASEANNSAPESGHAMSNGNDDLQQNGLSVENETSQQNHSLQNGDSKQPDSAIRKKTKQLMEEMEKNKEQRKEFLQREKEKLLVRTNSLGRDRDYNRYWFFRRDGRLFVESSDNQQWGYYCTKEELDALMASLNEKGIRERALKKQLEKFYSRICLEMQKRSKDIAQKEEAEDAVVRRSTRVRAPPRDNPALAFLKYINKWKED